MSLDREQPTPKPRTLLEVSSNSNSSSSRSTFFPQEGPTPLPLPRTKLALAASVERDIASSSYLLKCLCKANDDPSKTVVKPRAKSEQTAVNRPYPRIKGREASSDERIASCNEESVQIEDEKEEKTEDEEIFKEAEESKESFVKEEKTVQVKLTEVRPTTRLHFVVFVLSLNK